MHLSRACHAQVLALGGSVKAFGLDQAASATQATPAAGKG